MATGIDKHDGLWYNTNMKTQHTFSPMEFAQWYDKHGVQHAVTVLSVLHDGKAVKIHNRLLDLAGNAVTTPRDRIESH